MTSSSRRQESFKSATPRKSVAKSKTASGASAAADDTWEGQEWGQEGQAWDEAGEEWGQAEEHGDDPTTGSGKKSAERKSKAPAGDHSWNLALNVVEASGKAKKVSPAGSRKSVRKSAGQNENSPVVGMTKSSRRQESLKVIRRKQVKIGICPSTSPAQP